MGDSDAKRGQRPLDTITQAGARRAAAAKQCLRADASRRVEPDEEWVVRDARQILKNWGSYRLQAYGDNEDHKRLIRLNFIMPDKPDDGSWRQDLYVVADGGTAYWKADYDPATGEILVWQPNGDA